MHKPGGEQAIAPGGDGEEGGVLGHGHVDVGIEAGQMVLVVLAQGSPGPSAPPEIAMSKQPGQGFFALAWSQGPSWVPESAL